MTAPQTTEADKTLKKWKIRVLLSITSGMFFCINLRIKKVRSFPAGQCYSRVTIIVILTFESVMINPCLVPRSHYSTGATCLRSRDPSMVLKLNKGQYCFVKNKNRSIGLIRGGVILEKLNASNHRYFTHLSHHLTKSPE